MAAGDWSIEYYIDDSGSSPVGDFMRALDNKTFSRFEWSLEQLRVRNVQAREPLVKHVEGKLWELREESQTNIYRILYVFFTGRRIILLHGFQKKSPRLPGRELEIARQRLARFLEREGGDQRK